MTTDTPTAPPPLDSLVSMKVVHLFGLMRRRMIEQQRRDFDLSEIEWRILTRLTGNDELSLNGLADLLLQDRGQLSRAVKSLVERRLLTRRRRPGGPEIAIALSQDGRTLRVEMEQLALARDRHLTAGIDEGDLAAACRVLDRMIGQCGTTG